MPGTILGWPPSQTMCILDLEEEARESAPTDLWYVIGQIERAI